MKSTKDITVPENPKHEVEGAGFSDDGKEGAIGSAAGNNVGSFENTEKEAGNDVVHQNEERRAASDQMGPKEHPSPSHLESQPMLAPSKSAEFHEEYDGIFPNDDADAACVMPELVPGRNIDPPPGAVRVQGPGMNGRADDDSMLDTIIWSTEDSGTNAAQESKEDVHLSAARQQVTEENLLEAEVVMEPVQALAVVMENDTEDLSPEEDEQPVREETGWRHHLPRPTWILGCLGIVTVAVAVSVTVAVVLGRGGSGGSPGSLQGSTPSPTPNLSLSPSLLSSPSPVAPTSQNPMSFSLSPTQLPTVRNGFSLVGQEVFGSSADDRFGYSVALSANGTMFAATAKGGNYASAFQLNGEEWLQVGSRFDNLGTACTVSSDGSIVALSNGTRGEVKVFRLEGNGWVQQGQILQGTDDFGHSISLSEDGSVLALGAPQFQGDRTGYVVVFRYDGFSWTQIGGNLTGLGPEDSYGWSVSLSGDGSVLTVGACQAGTGQSGDFFTRNPGYVQVFRFDGANWNQLGQDVVGVASSGWFGFKVSLSFNGDTFAATAPLSSLNGGNSGHVSVYRYEDSAWKQLGDEVNGRAFSHFGESVGLSADGNIFLASAGFASMGGYVRLYLYNQDDNDWIQIGGDLVGERWFGLSVALSFDGTTVITGSPLGDRGQLIDAGYVRVDQVIQ